MSGQVCVTQAGILGSWQLHRAMEQRGDRARSNPNYGPDPVGFLHYMPDGRVSVIIANGGRPPLSTPGRRDAPLAELAQAAQTFDAYAGRYTLLGPNQIAHHITVSSFQNDVGTDLIRHISLSDDLLCLTPPDFEEDGQVVTRWLVWRRLSTF